MTFAAGILFVIIGGALEGLFSLPVTRTPKWQWENVWGLGSLAALVLVPWPVALCTVPRLGEVFSNVEPRVLAGTLLLGLGCGLGGIVWGKAVAALGMALGISLLMGLLNVFAAPMLLVIRRGAAELLTPGGLTLLTAVALMVAGAAICAAAGAAKQRDLPTRSAESAASLIVGLIFCVVSAVLSSLLYVAFVYGEPLRVAALKAHASETAASNAIWAIFFTGAYLVNTVYAFALMFKNKTIGRIVSHGSRGHWLWALFMGVAWPLGILLFGVGSDWLGKEHAAFVAFPVMLVTAIVFGNLAGALTGEWRGTSAKTRTTMVLGLMLLVAAFAVFGTAGRLLQSP